MDVADGKRMIEAMASAWRAADLEGLAQLFAEDYTVNGAPLGREGVAAAVGMFHSSLSDLSLEIHDVLVEDDRIAARWSVTGRHTGELMGIPATGLPVELEGINIYDVRDGLFVANNEQTNAPTVLQELAAAGS